MPKVSIQMIPNHSVKLKTFQTKLKGNIKKGLSQVGRVLTKRAKRNISGLGFTRNPGRNSKYFGVLSGGIFASLKYEFTSNGTAILIGSNENYVGEVIPRKFGGLYKGSKITGHFLEDTLDQESKAITTIFNGEIWKPLK